MADDDINNADHRVWIERRLQSWLLGLATLGIAGLVALVFHQGDVLATIAPQVDGLKGQVAVMYRADDARRDVADMIARINAREKVDDHQELRIDDLDTRVRKVETRIRPRNE